MTEETYNLLEEAAQVQLRQVIKIDPETKEGKDHLAKTIHLVELLINTDRDNAECYDKQERRRIEEERNKAMNETERDKQKLTWDRVENATKYVVPTKDAGDALTLLDCDPTPVNSFETVASATDEALAKQIVKENVAAGETVKVGVAVWLEGTMQDDQDNAKTGQISVTLGFAAK